MSCWWEVTSVGPLSGTVPAALWRGNLGTVLGWMAFEPDSAGASESFLTAFNTFSAHAIYRGLTASDRAPGRCRLLSWWPSPSHHALFNRCDCIPMASTSRDSTRAVYLLGIRLSWMRRATVAARRVTSSQGWNPNLSAPFQVNL